MASPKKLDVLVVGAGVSGLAAARALTRQGRKVSLFDQGLSPGGLASGFSIAGQPAEQFYHFLCRSDSRLQALAQELGLETRWQNCTLGLWDPAGFRAASSLPAFLSLPLDSKLTTAFSLWRAGRSRNWKQLDRIPADQWLRKQIGDPAWNLLFDSVLKKKFGKKANSISAAWLWHRLHRAKGGALGPRYGWFAQGYASFFKALMESNRQAGVSHHFSKQISSLRTHSKGWSFKAGNSTYTASTVVAAVPAPILLKMAPSLKNDVTAKLKALSYQSLVQVVFQTKENISPYFWTNLNPMDIPFAGLIQYNLLDRKDRSLAYLPVYTQADSREARWTDKQALQAGLKTLKKIQPNFRSSSILGQWVFRDRWAQPVAETGFADKVAPHKVADNLYLLEATQFYPADRSLDSCLANVEKLMQEMSPS